MVKLDMKSMFENMMGGMQQSAGSDIDMTAEGFFIAIPPNLSVGDKKGKVESYTLLTRYK